MYLARLRLENVRHSSPGERVFTAGLKRIRRWTLLPEGDASTALLRGLALSSLGRWPLARLAGRMHPLLAADPEQAVQLELDLIRHAPQERGPCSPVRHAQRWRLLPGGELRIPPCPKRNAEAPPARRSASDSGRCQSGRLLLGYGQTLRPGPADFSLFPDQRWRRCQGLFEAGPDLTDPVAFLERLEFKGKYVAGRSRAVLDRLAPVLSRWLGWSVRRSLRAGDLGARWQSTPPSRRLPAMVTLDLARHAIDVSARLGDPDPFRQPGVVLFDRPETWCTAGQLADFFRLLDGCFPCLQFFLALSTPLRRSFPRSLRAQHLPVPASESRPPPPAPRRLSARTVLLVDVDGTLPNLALMKLSRHYRAQGRPVVLQHGIAALPPADTVLASCVFSTPASARRVEVLRRRYGAAMQLGGSGVDLGRRLAPEIEALAPDFSLYPELDDRALGFLTRGCPFHCPFCVVPLKEGAPRQVGDLETLLQGRRKLILLDDNLLAHRAVLPLMEEMLRRDLAVNFNQTLDLRLVTPEVAGLLRRLRCGNVTFTRRNLYFSLNDTRQLPLMRERYALLQTRAADNVAFVCMYGFNTTLAEDVARFRFLRTLPGAYVFVQRYLPVLGGPPPVPRPYFDDHADSLLSELVRIVFSQNMKSMETYYRWLALQYATTCGRIHPELVDTLFRYNGRARMGRFVARLEALCLRTPGSNRDAG